MSEVKGEASTAGEHLILYDGVCGLCSRVIQMVAPRDRDGVFHYAPLQSAHAQALLRRHGRDPSDLDTFYVVTGHRSPAPALLARSDAALFIARTLGGSWRWAGALARLLPRRVRDWGYDRLAAHRYRLFGRSDRCLLPAPEYRRRLVDS